MACVSRHRPRGGTAAHGCPAERSSESQAGKVSSSCARLGQPEAAVPMWTVVMVIRHRQRVTKDESILTMTPEALARTVEDFLAGSTRCRRADDGAAVFDLAQAKYSISGEHNKCLLHLWSAERNLVRRVLDVEIKHEVLRMAGGAAAGQPPGESWRSAGSATVALPTAKRAARAGLPAQLAAHRWNGVSPPTLRPAHHVRRSGAIVSARFTPAGSCDADSPASRFWA